MWDPEPHATAHRPDGGRQEKKEHRTRRLKLTAWLEGALEAPLGGQKARESPKGTLGSQGGQAAGCQWPQAYKSKRGASAGRGTAGRVGEAGPFLLGKSRRARVSAGAEWQAGSLGEFWGGPAGAELGEGDSPKPADTVTPSAEKGRSPLGATGPGWGEPTGYLECSNWG